MKKVVEVAAAIILVENKVFAARRKQGSHLAGYWEFPGGKIEDNETPEQCLFRELEEELSIRTKIGHFLGENRYDYGSKVVRLLAYKVEYLEGSIQLTDHDAIKWLSAEELRTVNWAPADIPLVDICRDIQLGL